MERVAARARASKASLYRRWPSRADLVADAIRYRGPELADFPETGTLRGDLIALLRGMADQLNGPFGEAVRGVLAETLADPGRTAAARSRMTGLGGAFISEILARAAARGEISGWLPGSCAVRAAPVLLLHHFLVAGTPIPDQVLAEIVDGVALPALGAARYSRGHPAAAMGAPEHPAG
jgi:AcrR family transcriptional regulator